MNGFTHSILSLLLGWIRSLISSLWNLFSSEDGGLIYRFFSENWLKMLAVLCIGGIVVDLLVYVFRWRPYYVWMSRLRRLRGKAAYDQQDFEDDEMQVVVSPPFRFGDSVSKRYAPLQSETRIYAPVEDSLVQEDAVLWDAQEDELELDADVPQMFGSPRQEPRHSYHDIQAGYAPPVSPQQLYTPSASYQPPMQEEEGAPVHPGLNDDMMRQSFGLFDEDYAQKREENLVMHAPAFHPFTAVDDDAPAMKTPGALSRLARRARNFVSMEDDENGPTFRDLQSTVDVSQAFHAPVYPQPMNHKEG